MADHLNRFLSEHPELTLVSSATEEDREVLLKAEEKRYVQLTTAPGGKKKCFTIEDLEKARMWKEKGGLDD